MIGAIHDGRKRETRSSRSQRAKTPTRSGNKNFERMAAGDDIRRSNKELVNFSRRSLFLFFGQTTMIFFIEEVDVYDL